MYPRISEVPRTAARELKRSRNVMNTYDDVPHRAAYERGVTAKERGKGIEECPYGVDQTRLRIAWMTGFGDATTRASSARNLRRKP